MSTFARFPSIPPASPASPAAADPSPAGPGRPAPARLRLVGRHDAAPGPAAALPPERVSEATDPRWVLATRTAALLEGPVLVPENRRRLLAVGAAVGLSPFDTALVIAMVQDQARRGVPLPHCPAAAEPQLRHVPRPRGRKVPWRTVAIGSLLALAAEAALAVWWFTG
ncbi:hypothetical protein [Phycisphaera mikurensis]|uniref:Uncharacterized protein n=1 Tax=Phycisphaera mikurensis (strain NBRC 102666 / KCTC 22515 / FYK2301M01) TaxID=1142394 RepID=I0IBR9_PHYMF|nr:hypothetical protein [Phycisphaera mikurensis]MBB6442061.1 hypothetical protein [Phycisphaera mikurensis]BAM02707.1 hypothetical protein PSMK_05480 [Phycisphaera mikurensis NBRC 102666]